MTTTANPTKATPAKSAPTKAADKPADKNSEDRISPILQSNPILADICKQYLAIHDQITEYNKAVIADRDSEWNASKVLEKAREFARPTDKNVEADENVKNALDTYEDLLNKVAQARKGVLDVTSKKLGITLSATAQRDSEVEAPLKEQRKLANEIGNQLLMIAKLTSDKDSEGAVVAFLDKNPLPVVGRDQVRTFGNDGKGTPKYRVTVNVYKDGNQLLSEDGFSKTALKLTQPVFGYDRGKAPKSDDLRAAWEKPGNTPDKTVESTVVFEDNGLKYEIIKK